MKLLDYVNFQLVVLFYNFLLLITTSYLGRSLHLPADGLLLCQRDASAVDLLLGDRGPGLGVRGGQVTI